MTRQEAIAILERLQEPEAWEPQISEDAYTALEMAIDALNDVPDRNVGDMISRQVALKEIEEWISALYENAHHESASDGKMILNAIKHLPSVQPTLYGYNIEHLELIARVLRKENLPPERVAEALMDIGRIVAIVTDEFEETIRKSFEQCMDFAVGEDRRTDEPEK